MRLLFLRPGCWCSSAATCSGRLSQRTRKRKPTRWTSGLCSCSRGYQYRRPRRRSFRNKIQDQSRSRRRRYTYPHRRKDPARALRDTLKFGIRNSECGIIVSGFAGGFRLYTYLGRTPQNSQGCNNAALAQLVEKVITAVNCKKQWGKTLTFLRQTSFVSPTHTPLAPLNRLTARQRAE